MNRRDLLQLFGLAPLALVKPPFEDVTPQQAAFYNAMMSKGALSRNQARTFSGTISMMCCTLWHRVEDSLPPLNCERERFMATALDGKLWVESRPQKASARVFFVVGKTVYLGQRVELSVGGSEWVSEGCYVFGVTHWANLPSLPLA